MTITNLPTYSQQYLSNQHHYHLSPPAAQHPHHSLHPAHPHVHHTQHPYTAHPHAHAGLTHAQHVLTGPMRTEPVTRKRPKYTRSKTGCLTCRVKKIKCDETKPTCTRCSHGQRECTWPENVPARKKPGPKKSSEQSEEQSPAPSHAESVSPTTSTSHGPREGSPARRSPFDGLLPSEGAVSSRRPTSEPNTAAGSPMASPIDPPAALSRRPSLQTGPSYNNNSGQPLRAQYSHSMTPPTVSPVSFHPSPSSPHDYHGSFNGSPGSGGGGGGGNQGHHHHHPHHHHGPSVGLSRHDLPSIQTSQTRLTGLGVDGMNTWQTSSMLQHESMEPSFYRNLQERNLIGRSTSYTS